MKLFEGQEQPKLKLKINKAFADKYQKKKQRELLDKKGALLEQNESSSSDQLPEDENGDLINDKVTQKFIETLAKIRYKHPDIYQNKQLFDEDDFEFNEKNQKEQKKLTYAALQAQEVEEEQDEEYEPNFGVTPEEEQLKLKSAFKQAAEKSKKEQKELLKVKQKTAQEIEDENKEFEKLLKKQKKNEDVDILQRYWGNEEKLDEKDKFLRKYILTKGWIDKDDDENNLIDSSEDEENMDQFEEKYNFRFEEEGGNELVTYERNITNTLRQDPETARQRQRQAKAQREKEQKLQLEKELKELKSAKKNEIIQKLQKIQNVGGVKNAQLLLEEINIKEFQPEEFDKKMEKLFNEDYFEDEEESPEEFEEKEDEEENQQEEAQNQGQDVDNVIKVKQNIPIIMKKNLNQEELNAIQEEDVTIWWFCDICKQTIQPNNFRWDCQVCDDYTLCENCSTQHPLHKLKRILVPKTCKPPQQEEAEQLINQFKYCRACQIKMTEENDYYESKKDYLCLDCYEKDKNQKRYHLIEAKIVDVNKLLDENPEQLKQKLPGKMKQLIDEYYSLDFEDVIAGGIKTKFQYIDVEKQDFGLTNDDLLYADDKLLNQYVSIKKLAPYRDEEIKIKKNKAERLLTQIRKSTKRNKKLILKGVDPKQFQKKKLEQEQEEKKQKAELEIEDAVENTTLQVNSKRLKSYGV